MNVYNRTLLQLRENATLYWSQDLLQKAGEASVLPLLLKTQDKFMCILTLADSSPDAWKKIIDISNELKANVFLKHLMILCDLGGEALNKYPPLSKFYPDGIMNYVWRDKTYNYKFKEIHKNTSLNNNALRVDGKNLIKGHILNDKIEDVIMLLLYASSSLDNNFPDDIKEKCLVGTLLGDSQQIKW